MSTPTTHRFRACELRIWPEAEYVETVFPDGRKAGATRDCELSNLAYAQHLAGAALHNILSLRHMLRCLLGSAAPPKAWWEP